MEEVTISKNTLYNFDRIISELDSELLKSIADNFNLDLDFIKSKFIKSPQQNITDFQKTARYSKLKSNERCIASIINNSRCKFKKNGESEYCTKHHSKFKNGKIVNNYNSLTTK